jgi:hypothetical protein
MNLYSLHCIDSIRFYAPTSVTLGLQLVRMDNEILLNSYCLLSSHHNLFMQSLLRAQGQLHSLPEEGVSY